MNRIPNITHTEEGSYRELLFKVILKRQKKNSTNYNEGDRLITIDNYDGYQSFLSIIMTPTKDN
jgi:hypothetical protein